MSDETDEHQQHARTQTEAQAASAGHRVSMESQARKVNERKHNPRFYDKFTESSVTDSEMWRRLVDREATWLADDHVLSNRRQVHRLQRQLLNQIRAEQSVVAGSPGARLREKPLLHALAQGVHPQLDEMVPLDAAGQATVDISDPEFTPSMDSQERRALDDLAKVATARQAMGVEQAGSEALTTATTESRTVREDETEADGIVGSVSGVFD